MLSIYIHIYIYIYTYIYIIYIYLSICQYEYIYIYIYIYIYLYIYMIISIQNAARVFHKKNNSTEVLILWIDCSFDSKKFCFITYYIYKVVKVCCNQHYQHSKYMSKVEVYFNILYRWNSMKYPCNHSKNISD